MSPAEGRDRIELRGLRALGTHGVLVEEKDRPQPFEIDLDIEADLSQAGRSDALADTVDYGRVAEAVVGVVAGAHTDLLEHLAERIASAVLELAGPAAQAVTVGVRKLRPPVGVDLASAGVRVRRARSLPGGAGLGFAGPTAGPAPASAGPATGSGSGSAGPAAGSASSAGPAA